MRVRWETDGKSLWLNKKCCPSVLTWSLWPLYILGCLLLLIFASIIVVACYDFYLSDRNNYLEVNNNKMGIYELIFLGLIGLTLVAFLFVWIFHTIP